MYVFSRYIRGMLKNHVNNEKLDTKDTLFIDLEAVKFRSGDCDPPDVIEYEAIAEVEEVEVLMDSIDPDEVDIEEIEVTEVSPEEIEEIHDEEELSEDLRDNDDVVAWEDPEADLE